MRPTGSQQAKVRGCLGNDPQENVGRHCLHDTVSSCNHPLRNSVRQSLPARACSCSASLQEVQAGYTG